MVTFICPHYNTSYSASATVSTYCNYTPHGIGWHTYTFTDFIRNGTSSLITTAHNSVYSISQADLKYMLQAVQLLVLQLLTIN